jgi:hypothetical protein
MIRRFRVDKSQRRRSWWDQGRRGRKCSALVLAFAAISRPRALLVAENFCLRQQLLVLQRRHPRPRLRARRVWPQAHINFANAKGSAPLMTLPPRDYYTGIVTYYHVSRRWLALGESRVPG